MRVDFPNLDMTSWSFDASLLGNDRRITRISSLGGTSVGDLGRAMRAVWIAAGDGSDYPNAVKSFQTALACRVISGPVKMELKRLWKLADANPFIDYLDELGNDPIRFYFTLWQSMRSNQRLPNNTDLRVRQCVTMIEMIR